MTIGQSIGKADLLKLARDFQASTASNATIPYQRAMKQENDAFVGSLQNAPDGTLAEIKANALAQSQALNKKGMLLSVAGMGITVASFMLPLPGGQLVRFAVMGAGFFVSQRFGGRAIAEANQQRYFASQLGEWQRSIDSQASQPSQPPVAAPAQPPAPAPQLQP